MFRYLGFSWNPAAEAQTAAAMLLERSILAGVDWQQAMAATGLRVFTVGGRPGVNGVYALPSARGVVLGRLFRRGRNDLGESDVKLTDKEAERITQTDGQALVDDYWGRYVALLRPAMGRPLLLRDPSGALPCYRCEIDGLHVFFSWLEDLLAFTPAVTAPRVNWEAVAARLALRELNGCDTALECVQQVLPGLLVSLGEGAPPPRAVWRASSFARQVNDDASGNVAIQLRQVVMDCTRDWSSCHESILLRLSGGLDSAIVLGSLVAERSATRVTCLNYHSVGADSDERAFARMAAVKAGVELIERERDPVVRLEELLTASRLPTPENYLGRLGTGRLDALAANARGARAMFTGIGGDVLFLQLRQAWPAADYLSVRGFDHGFLPVCLDAARLGRVSLIESFRQALANQRHDTSPLDGWGRFTKLIRHEALEGVRRPERYVHPEMFEAGDLPIGKYNQLEDLIIPSAYYDPYLCEAAPELVNPLLSQPVVERCLAIPTWQLTEGGRARGLVRKAFAGDIPIEIAKRQSKGGMNEHAAAILRRNLAFAQALLLDGQLVRRGILDGAQVEAALNGRLSAVHGYANEIHECIAVEAWLQRIGVASC